MPISRRDKSVAAFSSAVDVFLKMSVCAVRQKRKVNEDGEKENESV